MSPTDYISEADALQKMLLQLRKSFVEDMPEKLDNLEHLLVEMEKSGDNGESFSEFYRIVHNLKGSGGTYGLQIITTICHQLEDLLNTTEGGAKFTPELISISLDYVDLLRLVTKQIQAGDESFVQVEKQLDKLRKQLAKKQFTVLLVENSRLESNIYQKILAALPVRIVMMNDGGLALMRALTEPFDLIITSNEIPVLNGVALIGALKLSDSQSRNTKAILITSRNNPAASRNSVTDADYTVIKDETLANSLVDAVKDALSITRAN